MICEKIRSKNISNIRLGGLESSGRVLVSLNGKTKRIANFLFIFFGKKNIFSKF